MWIKICGNTNLEDARFAAEAGADALGFVFAPSPRQVNAEIVREIVSKLPSETRTYGVFMDTGFDEIVQVVAHTGLTGVQIHRPPAALPEGLLPSRLRQHFAQASGHFDIVTTLNYQNPAFAEQLSAAAGSEGVLDAVLVDSSTARAVGGTGTRFDWPGARKTFHRYAPGLRLIAAGGLSPDNVEQAIEILRPWGVDVVSGVESKPGKKDPERVLSFIQTAQRAGKEAAQAVQP